MIEKELVSIIIPIYNVELYLKKCVQSVIDQTYNNLEILLVDDGSKDTSGLICDELKELDSRIKVFHKKNGGLADARNYGINNANGKYLYFLDSDDYIKNTTIEDLYNSIKQSNADVSVGKFIYVDDEKEIFTQNLTSKFYDNENIQTKQFLYDAIFAPSFMVSAVNKLYKKELIDSFNHRFEHNHLIFAEDYLFNMKLLCKLKKIVINEESIYYYYQNPKSIIHTYKKSLVERYINLLKSLVDFYKTNNDGIVYKNIIFFTLFNIYHNCSLNEYENSKHTFSSIKRTIELINKNNDILDKLKKYIEFDFTSNISFFNRLFFKLFKFCLRKNSNIGLSIIFYVKFKIRNR